MLDFSYSDHYAELVQSTDWNIELPSEWSNFFQEKGLVESLSQDHREKQRRIVRLHGLAWVQGGLPSVERPVKMLGIYTRDFANDSCGIVTPVELYPDECVRLILPSFWLSLKVWRVVRHTKTCYEVGLKLLKRHDADRAAFIANGKLVRG